jgi:membrane-associated phospholipid phosphatase
VRRCASRTVASLASPVAFVLLARTAARGDVSTGEERFFRSINTLSPALRRPAWLVMQAGSLAAVPVTAAVAFRRDRRAALALAIDGTAVWALCKLVKRVIKRGRPADHLDDVVVVGKVQRGRGFPSGHAAVATTLTTVGARLLSRPGSRLVWVAPVMVCAARQLVGAHLPLDVAGGVALGITAGTITNMALDGGRSMRV